MDDVAVHLRLPRELLQRLDAIVSRLNEEVQAANKGPARVSVTRPGVLADIVRQYVEMEEASRP